MSYYGVPADVLEDGEELARWARKSVAVASMARTGPARPRNARRPATHTKTRKR
jgi:TfoX/Sxy family transcriptional regulator of competence genes